MLRKITFILLIYFFNACASKQVKSFSIWKEPVTGMEFILIPKGSFLMGNHEHNDKESSPELAHRVRISRDFWLARFEVSRKQWQLIMGNIELHPEKPSPFHNANPQYPIVSVSCFDVQEFLNKLNDLSDSCHFRLPSEAEWEYACRAGTTTPFSCGINLSDSLANFNWISYCM